MDFTTKHLQEAVWFHTGFSTAAIFSGDSNKAHNGAARHSDCSVVRDCSLVTEYHKIYSEIISWKVNHK